jgi:hypothetical protein
MTLDEHIDAGLRELAQQHAQEVADMRDVARLRVGDVVINHRGRRYHVVGFTPRGKLRLKCPELKGEMTGWWPYAASLPLGYRVWRGEMRLR